MKCHRIGHSFDRVCLFAEYNDVHVDVKLCFNTLYTNGFFLLV